MKELTESQKMRHAILKETGMDVAKAREAYQFIVGNEDEHIFQSQEKPMLPNGAYILDTQNVAHTCNRWKGDNEDAVGVLLKTDKVCCIIAPTESPEALKWAKSEREEISEVTTTTSNILAINDFAGRGNTQAIIDALGEKNAPAASFCLNYKFKNGSAGHLPSAGEWAEAVLYKNAIDSCLNSIGGNPLSENVWYWSSTQYSSTSSWILYWTNGNINFGSKYGLYYVRAFAAFDPSAIQHFQ